MAEHAHLPSGWSWRKLSDLGEVARGKSKHRPRWDPVLYGGRYPFVQTGDIKASGGRITRHEQTYSEAGLAQSRLWPAGTMCITIAANIAETGILSFPACFPDSVVGFIPATQSADVHFVEYSFRHLKSRIQHEATGSVQDNINLRTIERLLLPVPPLHEQQAIASILGALDDKIELSRRMNQTLEEMAQAIFKSWFADFDGHTEFEESELGRIPKGWRVLPVADLCDRVAMGPFGSSIKVATFVPAGIPVISGQHLHGILLEEASYNFITPDHAAQLANSNVQPGDVVFTHAGTLGQVALIPEQSRYRRYQISQRQFYLRPAENKLSGEYFAYYFHSPPGRHALLANTSSTGVPSISRPVSYLRQLRIPVPPPPLVTRFTSVVQGLHSRQLANRKETATLTEIRDTLLPKLISGEIRIPEAEKLVENVA